MKYIPVLTVASRFLVGRPPFASSCRDCSLSADAPWKNLMLSRSQLGTGIRNSNAADLQPRFSKKRDGAGNVAGSTVAASLMAAF